MENEELPKEIASAVTRWFEKLDEFNSVPFLFDREQPITPKRQIFNESNED